MEQITSFCINHDILGKGMYVSRIDKDIVTYDLRMVMPNGSVYLENDGLHTFEHLFATFVRNSTYSEDVVYVGPMGCRTGFYFLTRDTISKEEVLELVKNTMLFIMDFHDAIPGAAYPRECGNILDHNLDKANAYAKDYYEVIKDWTVQEMVYPE